MSADNIYKSVPFLDGSTYTVWAQGMVAVLCARGVWQITRGHETRPVALAQGATQEDKEKHNKEILDFDN